MTPQGRIAPASGGGSKWSELTDVNWQLRVVIFRSSTHGVGPSEPSPMRP